MSARGAVHGELMWPKWNPTSESHGTSRDKANALLDAYRAEVLREAIGTLRAAASRCRRREPVAAWRVVDQIFDLIEPEPPAQ